MTASLSPKRQRGSIRISMRGCFITILQREVASCFDSNWSDSTHRASIVLFNIKALIANLIPWPVLPKTNPFTGAVLNDCRSIFDTTSPSCTLCKVIFMYPSFLGVTDDNASANSANFGHRTVVRRSISVISISA